MLSKPKPTLLPILIGFVAIALAAGSAPAQDGPTAGDSIDLTREQLEKWVETRRIISQEKQELKETKEILTERIALVQSEIESLRARIAETNENIAKTDDQFNELTEKNDRLIAASETLAQTIAKLESRTRQLLDRSPRPIIDRVKALSQQIPDDPNDTKLTLTNRFGTVIGVLNEFNKFSQQITDTSERMDLPDGSAIEASVVYLGISKAYYVGGNGQYAGVNKAGEDEWDWEPHNDVAAKVQLTIDIFKDQGQIAQFVLLPFETR